MKRIIASVMTNNHQVAVEIMNVFTGSAGRRIASIKALPVNGKGIQPFTEYTMGGPCQTSDTRIPVVFLKNIQVAEDTVNPNSEGSL